MVGAVACRVACLGEMLLRLSAPDGELLLQSPRLEARFGGAEANVAVALAALGHEARLLSALPDDPLGRAARGELRRHGVDDRFVATAPGRMGLYWLQPGAVRRPSEVTYDRAHSAFALHAGAIDLDAGLEGCARLHVSGVTAAVSAAGEAAALAAARAARARGLAVSVDGNRRAKLWAARRADGSAAMRALMGEAELVFGDARDLGPALGRAFDHADPEAREREAARAAFAAFPNLARVCATRRVEHAVGDHALSARLFARGGGEATAGPVRLSGIVDRIGAGDAFAAGVLHGLMGGWDDGRTVGFGLAAAAWKHSVAGDFSPASEADVLAGEDGGLGVRR